MTEGSQEAQLARLIVQLEGLQERFERLERDMEKQFERFNNRLASLDKIAFIGRVVLGVFMTIGAFLGWAVSQWNNVKQAIGR